MKTNTQLKRNSLFLLFIAISVQSNAQFNLSLTETTPISCYGQHDATIYCQTNSLGSYLYYLDGGSAPSVNGYFTMIAPGTHTVCASDGVSADVCQTIDINTPMPLDIIFTTDSLVSCNGNDGSLSIDILGGTAIVAPFLTQWTNALGDSVSDAQTNFYSTTMTGLGAGQYNVRIEDDHGCVYSESYVVQYANPLTVSANYENLICYGATSNVTLQSSGGVNYAPISYLINGSSPFSAYSAGAYNLIAIDAKGCTANTFFQINEFANDSVGNIVSTCNQYIWNGAIYTTTGNYTYTQVNTNGCIATSTLSLIIAQSSSSYTEIQFCNALELYQWHTGAIAQGGIYTHTLFGGNSFGCDSVLTLNLTYLSGIRIAASAMLYGAFDATAGLMKDSLRRVTHHLAANTSPAEGQIEVSAPVCVIPMVRSKLSTEYLCMYDGDTILGNGDGDVAQTILSTSGDNAIVDWIMLEIRSGVDSNIILATKNALLQRDGDIVSCNDGVSALEISCICPNESYYISVRHRNHLGIMSMNKILLTNAEDTEIDFSNPSTAVWVKPGVTNVAPRAMIAGKALLWGGDANNNKSAKYNGMGNDKEFILNDVGGPGNSNISIYRVYKKTDVNMDGKIRYQNNDNDRAFLLGMIQFASQINSNNEVIGQHTPN